MGYITLFLGSNSLSMGCMSRCKGQFVHIPPPENNYETEDDSSDESETDHETEEDDPELN